MSDQQNHNSSYIAPSEAEIEALLSRFLPTPSANFYLRMEKTPWVKEILRKKERINNAYILLRRRIILISVVFLLLVIIGISFIPSVQAVARQIIYSFLPAPSDKIEVQVSLSSPGDLFNFADSDNFPLSIEEVQEQADFIVKEIIPLPEDITLVGSRFDADYNTVTTLHLGPDFKLFVMQRPTGKGKDVFSIGSTAQVNLVMINNYRGEFVMGGWKAISTQAIPDTITPDNQASINAIWDNNLPQYTLRWKGEGFVYEIRSIGKGSPSQTELISLANKLK